MENPKSLSGGIEIQFKQLQELYDMGFSLIPLNAWNEGHDDKKGKAPKDGLAWEKYQHERADWKTIETWFKTYPNCNWGIICGEISGNLTVIDFDDPEIYYKIFPKHEDLEQETIVVKTGRGYQVYLKGITESKDIHAKDGSIVFEIRSNGRYVVAPGSKHKTGVFYEIVGTTKILEVEDIAQKLIEKAEKVGYKIKNKPEIDIEAILKGVNKGDRDNSLIKLITFLRKIGKTESEALKVCYEWNKRNKPQIEHRLIEHKVNYHYERAEPYNYFFKQNPAEYGITEGLELLKKQKVEDKIPATPKKPLPRLQDIKLHLQSESYILKYLKYALRSNDAYYEYHFALALIHLSIAVDRKLSIKMVQQTIYPNLWIFCLGDSTISRKSAAAGKGEEMGCAVFGQEKFLPQAGSPEALVEILSDTPRGVIWRDEAGQLLKEMEKTYMSEIKDFFCRLYDNVGYHRKLRTSQRKNQKTEFKITEPYVTMFLATVPDIFKEYTNILDVTSGWLVRFLYFTPDYEKPYMPFRPETEEDIAAWADALACLRNIYLKIQANPGEVKLHPEALKRFQQWQETSERKLMENKNKIEMAIFGRLVTYCLKLSLLLTISEDPDAREIQLNKVEDSISLIDGFFKPTSTEIIEEIGLDEQGNLQDKIIGIIKRSGGKITQRQLLKRLHKPIKEVNDAIDALIASGELIKEDVGNQQIIYKLNVIEYKPSQDVPGVPNVSGVPHEKEMNGTPVDTLNKKDNTLDALTCFHSSIGTPGPQGTPGTPEATNKLVTELCGICGNPLEGSEYEQGRAGEGMIHLSCKKSRIIKDLIQKFWGWYDGIKPKDIVTTKLELQATLKAEAWKLGVTVTDDEAQIYLTNAFREWGWG